MDGTVQEGFICPICMQDLGSFHKLQHHFEASHSAEDKAVFDQIKGLFTKAKGRILGQESEISTTSLPSSSYQSQLPSNYQFEWEPQEAGITRSHMENFRKIRDARIDRFVIESNKALIRLDKLIFFDEFDKSKRKEFEQSLVPWVKDAHVPFCPTCGDRFNIARRKHHCRLCGAIMCKRCSLYVQYDLADQLVRTLKRTSLGPSRSRSATNLSGSLPLEPELNIRCCQDCYKLLIKRKERMDQQENQPLLVLLYEKLQNAVESASKIAPEYQHIADSLNQGEEGYDLGKANEMRFKLMKLYETVDVLSKKIAALDTNDEENPPPAVALRLQASIRSASHAYLQENMLTLPSLPSLPKLEILQKKRRQQQEEKLRKQMEEAEKERAEAQRFHELERLRREREDTEKKSSSLTNNAQNVNQVVLHDGWSAVTSKKETNIKTNDEENDPILEQIAYVREMISQAQAAGRAEEVQSLNKNLEELKNEHRRQVVAAFSSTATASRSSFSDRDQLNNPFYDNSDRSTLVTNSNPFVQESSSTDKGNPFLTSDDNSDNNNPFVEKDQPPVRTESDPLLLQIRYISQCLDKAIKSGKRDEVAILRENLRELKAVYNNQ